MKEFLQRKNIYFSLKRYGVDCLSAMAQGLFCSLLIGTIIKTLGQQTGIEYLVTIGSYAAAMAGPAMAILPCRRRLLYSCPWPLWAVRPTSLAAPAVLWPC